MRTNTGAFIFILIMLLLDTYVFQAVKMATENLTPRLKITTVYLFWGITFFSILFFFFFIYKDLIFIDKKIKTYFFSIIIGLFIAKFLASLFFLADDLRRSVQWLLFKILKFTNVLPNQHTQGISRSAFLSWLGITMGGTLFTTLLYGFNNKYSYQVIRKRIAFKNLPASFKGLRIVHISDIHAGSFLDKHSVEKGVNMIKAQQADLILFTGDLVNNQATEMDFFKEMFSTLKAPLGVYSILGNHDYGDYVQWPIDGITKSENLSQLKEVHANMGWRLLMNEHVVLEKNNQQIALLGIENWGSKARFPKYGRMDLAYAGAEKYPFKILLSHDPSHWDAQVRTEYKDIDLTLSGHTHGMQFGLAIPGFKWSPIHYIYKKWAGLYEEDGQKLYINRGFGFLGYPGRVGIMPEISVLELV